MKDFFSKSENETKCIAKDFARKLKTGNVVVLSGDLGAGKTKFVEGLLSFWGLESEISSPTFTIVNEYTNKEINIYHFDVYRLQDLDEFYAIGGTEYFEKGICIIEWGEMLEPILNKYIKITISKDSNNENFRTINIERIGEEC